MIFMLKYSFRNQTLKYLMVSFEMKRTFRHCGRVDRVFVYKTIVKGGGSWFESCSLRFLFFEGILFGNIHSDYLLSILKACFKNEAVYREIECYHFFDFLIIGSLQSTIYKRQLSV